MPKRGGKSDSKDDDYNEEKEESNWIVVVAAFTVNFISDGFMFCFGILLVELVDAFQASRALTALVGALMASCAHLIGPVAGSVCDVYGSRWVVVLGSIIGFIGLFTSVFAKSLPVLYVTFGVIGGVGLGLMYTPANASVIKHFNKKRALASGIATCGTGLGTVVMNLSMGLLSKEYGWRGALLLYSGLILNGVACGLLLPNTKKKPPSRIHKSDTTDTQENTNETLLAKGQDDQGALKKTDTPDHADEVLLEESQNGHNFQGALKKKDTNHTPEKSNKKFLTEVQDDRTFKRAFREMVDCSVLCDIRCIFFLLSTLFINLAYILPFSMLPDQVSEDGVDEYKASLLVSSIGFTVSVWLSLTLCMLGITNTISRLLLGWVGDRTFVNRVVMLEVVICLAGVTMAVSPLLTTFATKMIFTCSYGVFIGGYVMLLPVVLSDLFGQHIIGKTFGLCIFTAGLTNLVASPIAGWIFDQTGSYTVAFIIAGGEFIIGGIMLLLPDLIKKCSMGDNSDDSSSYSYSL